MAVHGGSVRRVGAGAGRQAVDLATSLKYRIDNEGAATGRGCQ